MDSFSAEAPPAPRRFFDALPGWLQSTRTGRALGGLVVDFFGTGSSAALSFVVTPLLLSLLGAPMYGFWITASQILLWLNLLDGGIGVNLVKTIGANKDRAPERVERAIASTFWCYVCISAATLLIGAGLTPFIARWTHLPAGSGRDGTITFAIGVLTSGVALVAVPTFYVILQGFQKLALVNGLVTGVNIVGSLTGLLLVWIGFGVVGLAVGQLASTVVGAVFAFYWSRKQFPFSLSPRNASRDELLEMGHFALYFTMSKLAFLGSKYSDTILIAMYYGTAPVTQFSLTQKLASVAFMFAAKVGPVTVPGLAEMIGSGDKAALQNVVLRLTMILSRVAIAASAFILALNHRFVSLWTGEATFGGLLLTALFAWGIFRDTMIRNLSALLFASGELKGWGVLSMAEAGVKIGLSAALLPSMGIVAPVVGTAVGELITGIYTPLKLRSLLGLDVGRMFTGAFLPALLRSLPMLAVLTVLTLTVPLQWRWFGIAVIAFAAGIANVAAFDRGRLAAFARQIAH